MEEKEGEDMNTLKIIVIGNTNTGKSSVISRFLNNEFDNSIQSTKGSSFFTKDIYFEEHKFSLNIWDMSGQERYKSFGIPFFGIADGCFIVYDITDEESFKSVDEWYNMAHKYKKDKEFISIVLVGNKCDLETDRKVSKEDGIKKAKEKKIPFFETSALDSTNVEEIFKEMLNGLVKTSGLLEKLPKVPTLKKPLNIEEILGENNKDDDENENAKKEDEENTKTKVIKIKHVDEKNTGEYGCLII